MDLLPLFLAAAAAAAPPPNAAPATDQVVPVAVRVRITTADGGAPAGLVLRVRARAVHATVPIDRGGRVAFTLPDRLDADSVELIVDAADGLAPRYHPAVVRIGPGRMRRELQDERQVVLVPREWTVSAGQHAGTRVQISLERAYRPTCLGCSGFFPRGSTPGAAAPPGGVPGWRGHRFPLRVAFDRSRSDQAITPRDSAAFWQIATDVEAAFGRRLFRPVTYRATLPTTDDGTDDVVLVWVVPSLGAPGRAMTGFDGERIVTAALWLQNTSLLRSAAGRAVVAHELMHALGFGHTCSWRSVVADVRRCPEQRAPRPTAEDVAYVELALAVNALTGDTPGRWAIAAALIGERWTLQGLAGTRRR